MLHLMFPLGSSHKISYVSFNSLQKFGVPMSLSVDTALRKAHSHLKAGELAEAEELYKQVLSKFPKNKKALLGYTKLKSGITSKNSRASKSPKQIFRQLAVLCEHKQFKEVLSQLRPLIGRFPNNITLYNLQGLANEGLEKYDAAIISYKHIIKINPNYLEGYNSLGSVLHKKGCLEAAESIYKQAIKISPDYFEGHNNLGNVLQDKFDYEEAIESYKKAINIKPESAECYNNMGNSQKIMEDFDAAISSYKKALHLNPNYAPAYYGLGVALTEEANFDSALECCNNAIRLQPNFPEAQFLKSRLLLNCHKFELGWSLYTTSRDVTAEGTRFVTKRAERWKGSSLRGKNIQVYSAQGVADEILFSSCIPDLIQKKPKAIFLECDPRLQPLFARSFPEVVAYGRARTQKLAEIFNDADNLMIDVDFDYSIPIDGPPQFFRNRIEDFPKRNSFLIPHPELVNKWSARLKNLGVGLKVGISWRKFGKTREDKIIKKKLSIPLWNWKNLLSAEAFFINLQYGDVNDEVFKFSMENNIKIYDWEDNDPLIDLDNQATLISELDLVISVDTAAVHSCVALGTEVWNLMDPGLNLMWIDNGKNVSPLSPHLRLFKKSIHDSWDTVLRKAEVELRTKIAVHRRKVLD